MWQNSNYLRSPLCRHLLRMLPRSLSRQMCLSLWTPSHLWACVSWVRYLSHLTSVVVMYPSVSLQVHGPLSSFLSSMQYGLLHWLRALFVPIWMWSPLWTRMHCKERSIKAIVLQYNFTLYYPFFLHYNPSIVETLSLRVFSLEMQAYVLWTLWTTRMRSALFWDARVRSWLRWILWRNVSTLLSNLWLEAGTYEGNFNGRRFDRNDEVM